MEKSEQWGNGRTPFSWKFWKGQANVRRSQPDRLRMQGGGGAAAWEEAGKGPRVLPRGWSHERVQA